MTIAALFTKKYPPGPTGLSGLQTVRHLRQNPLVTLRDLAHSYGDLVHIGIGPYHVYLLNHPNYLHEMLVRQAGIMRKPRSLSRPIAEFLGNGLLISEGDYWRQQRRTVQPAFYPRHVPGYGQIMADCILHELATWKQGGIYDIDHEFMKMTLRMVTCALFSADVTKSGNDIANAVKILQRVSYDQGQTPVPMPRWIPLPAHLAKRRAIRLLDSLVIQIICTGRETCVNRNDLLTMLLNATDDHGEKLTEQQVRDEVMTVLLAGHESTANAITWMCYLLAQHPEAADKLRAEMDDVLSNRLPTVDDLKDLPYNAMVVKEALRLYPPAWALPREPAEDTWIGGYRIGKGSLLLGVPFVTHRDARYYADPDLFIPERFAGNAERHLPQHVYLPFGGGPRFCVGSTFALLAMQLTLALVYRQFDLKPVADLPVVLDPLLTLRPRFGIHMQASAIRKSD